MQCNELELILDAYLDHELEDAERTELECHLNQCEQCREEVAFNTAIHSGVRKCCHESAAPSQLRAKILAEIELSPPIKSSKNWREWKGWPVVALSSVGIALAGVAFTGLLDSQDSSPPSYLAINSLSGSLNKAANVPDNEPNQVIEQSVRRHRQQLPQDIAGPRENVRTWFERRLDFAIQFPHFPSKKVVLIGGRLTNFHDQQAALLTLESGKKKISLMIFRNHHPRRSIKAETSAFQSIILHRSHGYHVAIVHDGDLTYTFTSDLPPKELNHFIREGFSPSLHLKKISPVPKAHAKSLSKPLSHSQKRIFLSSP